MQYAIAPAALAKPAARLTLKQLVKKLGDTTVIDGIDLVIAPGELVVLLGPSGCGKTTTLRSVAGFLQPDAGEIHLNTTLAANGSFSLPPERRHLGMMFQSYAVWPHKTVFQNVAYGLQIAGVAKDEIQRRVMRILTIVNLDGIAERKPADLSGGQQQRVALARALVTEPTLLLLDEPLSNLDAALRQAMRLEIKALQRRVGVAMLYVTHDQDEALVLGDRIVVMNKGRIEQIGTPQEIYHSPRTHFVANFIGRTNVLSGVVSAIDDQGRAEVKLDIGLSIRVRSARILTAGQQCEVVVRPEQIQFVDSGAPVALEHVIFLGSRYELTLDIGGVQLMAESISVPPAPQSMAIADDAAWVLS